MNQAQTQPAEAGPAAPTIASEPGSLHALVLQSLDDDQAQDVVSIPLEGKTAIADHMLTHSGVYVIAFSFPVVPRGRARIRVQLSAAHTAEDVRTCAAAFTAARKALA